MSEDNKARIWEFIERVLIAGEIDATGDYFHDDVVEEEPFPDQAQGSTGSKIHWRAFAMRFGFEMEHRRTIAQDNKFPTRFVWSGTHQGEFLGVPLTDRVVRVRGMVIDRFEGG